ncbi:hypothetical protein HERIO_1942 [Hepatospora eriocheir]|uniref:Uncharacterized protein n=1 Tax=Hepatospora eriocheir TaxID=1081669 RepID=A0A1X0Q8H9_9MICR|nr:hypothetical protein HERIO_1942 [Hepatospora eriocheir]
MVSVMKITLLRLVILVWGFIDFGGITSGLKSLKEGATNKFNALKEGASSALNKAKESAGNLQQGLTDKANSLKEGINDKVNSLGESASGMLDSAKANLADVTKSASDSLSNTANGILLSGRDKINSDENLVKEKTQNIITSQMGNVFHSPFPTNNVNTDEFRFSKNECTDLNGDSMTGDLTNNFIGANTDDNDVHIKQDSYYLSVRGGDLEFVDLKAFAQKFTISQGMTDEKTIRIKNGNEVINSTFTSPVALTTYFAIGAVKIIRINDAMYKIMINDQCLYREGSKLLKRNCSDEVENSSGEYFYLTHPDVDQVLKLDKFNDPCFYDKTLNGKFTLHYEGKKLVNRNLLLTSRLKFENKSQGTVLTTAPVTKEHYYYIKNKKGEFLTGENRYAKFQKFVNYLHSVFEISKHGQNQIKIQNIYNGKCLTKEDNDLLSFQKCDGNLVQLFEYSKKGNKSTNEESFYLSSIIEPSYWSKGYSTINASGDYTKALKFTFQKTSNGMYNIYSTVGGKKKYLIYDNEAIAFGNSLEMVGWNLTIEGNKVRFQTPDQSSCITFDNDNFKLTVAECNDDITQTFAMGKDIWHLIAILNKESTS